MNNLQTRKEKIRYIAQIAVFTALSAILYFIRIPLPIFPSFLKVQFSALPIVICGFALGPTAGMIVLLCKALICLPMTESMYVGDLADFLIGAGYILTTSLIYSKFKTKRWAVISLIIGSVVWTLVASIVNYFVLVPFYLEMFLKGNVENFVGACSIIPGINVSNYKIMYVLLGALPFNLMLSTVVSLITFLVYKKVSNILKLSKEDE